MPALTPEQQAHEQIDAMLAAAGWKVQPYAAMNRTGGRWRAYAYDELLARNQANLDIFWLRDESLEETANLPEPDVLAEEMLEDLESAVELLRGMVADLGE
jgi:hypothetical protein